MRGDDETTGVGIGPLPFWFTADWSERMPGATPEQIAQAEAHLGRRLPDELRSLLLVQDGGVSNYAGFQDGDRYFPLLPFFGAGTTRGDTLMRAFDVREFFDTPPAVIVFASQGHSWWGLDYHSPGDEPRVVFQLDEESEIETVALTFRRLLAGLVDE